MFKIIFAFLILNIIIFSCREILFMHIRQEIFQKEHLMHHKGKKEIGEKYFFGL
jgi:hypothetical protein